MVITKVFNRKSKAEKRESQRRQGKEDFTQCLWFWNGERNRIQYVEIAREWILLESLEGRWPCGQFTIRLIRTILDVSFPEMDNVTFLSHSVCDN